MLYIRFVILNLKMVNVFYRFSFLINQKISFGTYYFAARLLVDGFWGNYKSETTARCNKSSQANFCLVVPEEVYCVLLIIVYIKGITPCHNENC